MAQTLVSAASTLVSRRFFGGHRLAFALDHEKSSARSTNPAFTGLFSMPHAEILGLITDPMVCQNGSPVRFRIKFTWRAVKPFMHRSRRFGLIWGCSRIVHDPPLRQTRLGRNAQGQHRSTESTTMRATAGWRRKNGPVEAQSKWRSIQIKALPADAFPGGG